MYKNKVTTVIICVCISLLFFFTLTKAHREPAKRPNNVSNYRFNRRFLKRITNVLREEERNFLPKSHQELSATESTLPMQTQRPHLPKYMLDLYEITKEMDDSVSATAVPWKRNMMQKEDIRPLIHGILPRRRKYYFFKIMCHL